MDIKDMQEKVCRLFEDYNLKNNVPDNSEVRFCQLIEEVGELAREIAKEKNDWRKEGFSKENLAKELIEVICNCLFLARDYDINLEEAFNNKLDEWKTRWGL